LGRACRVYKGGRLAASYPVELSTNWVGDKRHRGDKATPEGRYKVTRKRGPGSTKYYKALEIDYPNAEDSARFRAAKRRGELPPGTAIGGLIEIHGTGGRGGDWTEGCVALRNEHMDKVFAIAQVGTPVLIVGALAPPANASESSAAKPRSSGAR
jgi:murein L,D-transpeptidase YafK